MERTKKHLFSVWPLQFNHNQKSVKAEKNRGLPNADVWHTQQTSDSSNNLVGECCNFYCKEWCHACHAVATSQKMHQSCFVVVQSTWCQSWALTSSKNWNHVLGRKFETQLQSSADTLHCAKSCRPFELFANENCKLQNEAKMNAMFERGSAQDPWRSPLSAEMNDASAWKIGVPDVHFVVTLFTTTASCQTIQNKTCLNHMHLDMTVQKT